MFQIDIRSENFAFAGLFCTRWVEIFTGMCYNDELLEPVTSVSLYTALPVSDLYAFTVFLLQLLSIPFRGQKTHLTRYFSYFSYFFRDEEIQCPKPGSHTSVAASCTFFWRRQKRQEELHGITATESKTIIPIPS